MSAASRRSVLAVAGAGTATLAGTVLAARGAMAAPAAEADRATPRPTDPIVAYVANPRSGHVVLVSGDARTTFTDHALAARLAATVRGS